MTQKQITPDGIQSFETFRDTKLGRRTIWKNCFWNLVRFLILLFTFEIFIETNAKIITYKNTF